MDEPDQSPPSPDPQPDMFAGAPPAEETQPKSSGGQAKSLRSLERLRDRISLVSRELQRLRDENLALHKEVEQLQMHGMGAVEGTPVVFSESPAELRAQVESFIDSIDDYLQQSEASTQNRSE